MEFKNALVFDRIAEELKIYCAGHNIDDVYNTKFLEISPHVLNETRKSIERLSNGSVHIINLVIPKPDIPLDIAENYKQVQCALDLRKILGVNKKFLKSRSFLFQT